VNYEVDTLAFEPRAFRMRNGCDTITQCTHVLKRNWAGPAVGRALQRWRAKAGGPSAIHHEGHQSR
jgi:hypothetical protein